MSSVKLFESKGIQPVSNTEEEKWYFPTIDTIETLTETHCVEKYWRDLKTKLNLEDRGE